MKKGIARFHECMGTLFASILSGEVPSHRVASGEGWYAFLDIFPRRSGHTLVIPTQSVQRLAELTQGERSSLMDGVNEVQTILGAHFGTEDFTICVHDGPLAGQEVPHVHVHVLPRTAGDQGGTLVSMWPSTETAPPDHEALSVLAQHLQEAS